MPSWRQRMLGVIVVIALLTVAGLATPAEAQIFVYVDDAGRTYFSDVQHHPGFRPFRPRTRAGGRQGAAWGLPDGRNAWDGVIRRLGRAYGVSPALVKAVIHAESNFDPEAVSSKGAQGLMQLMPATAQALGVDDPFNPWQNIDGGTRYLSYLMRRFPGDTTLALAAYNAGEQVVQEFKGVPPYPETRRYVKRVLKFYRGYDADFR